jgi:hypothetical protein
MITGEPLTTAKKRINEVTHMDKHAKIQIKIKEILETDKKITLQELEQLIYEIRNDCLNLYNYAFLKMLEPTPLKVDYQNLGFYDGEHNAFALVLSLMQHIEG